MCEEQFNQLLDYPVYATVILSNKQKRVKKRR